MVEKGTIQYNTNKLNCKGKVTLTGLQLQWGGGDEKEGEKEEEKKAEK